MNTLAHWLQTQFEGRGLTQATASVHAGVSAAIISEILNQDHIPAIKILLGLADCFETPREKILRVAARMPTGEGPPPEGEDDYPVEALLEELHRIPDEWKDGYPAGPVVPVPVRGPAADPYHRRRGRR